MAKKISQTTPEPTGRHRFPERFEETMGELLRLIEGLHGLSVMAEGMSWGEGQGKEVVVSEALKAFAATAEDIHEDLSGMDDEILWDDSE